jgi:membrane protease YdiL (CAAX protease family)
MSDAALDDPARAAYRPETPWRPAPAIIVALAASFAPILVSVAAMVAENHGLISPEGRIQVDGSPSLSSPFMLMQMIAGQILSLWIVWIAAGWRGARTSSLQLAEPQTDWLTAIAYGLALVILIGPIEVLLYRLAGVELFSDGRWLLEGLRSPMWWGIIIAAVVLAPLWEEITFRGFLLSALAKSRLGFWPAAVLSSLVWTLLHWGYSTPGLASVFLAGLGMSWIMRRTGSMRAVVVAHSVINACSLLIIYLFAPAT